MGGVTESDGLPPQPVNHMPALQSSNNNDMVRRRASSRRRLPIISGSKPGSANAAHQTAWTFMLRRGVESIRASPPVASVNTVLAVVAVPPENVTEAGWKLQEVFVGSPVQAGAECTAVQWRR
jgi:hypothetical protein